MSQDRWMTDALLEELFPQESKIYPGIRYMPGSGTYDTPSSIRHKGVSYLM